MGCPPIKEDLKILKPPPAIGAFTLPTSVTRASFFKNGLISFRRDRTVFTGVARTTRSASERKEPTREKASSTAFRRRASLRFPREHETPTTFLARLFLLSYRAMEPPIKPSPMMATLGKKGLMCCLTALRVRAEHLQERAQLRHRLEGFFDPRIVFVAVHIDEKNVFP